jgi:hypothetical protein
MSKGSYHCFWNEVHRTPTDRLAAFVDNFNWCGLDDYSCEQHNSCPYPERWEKIHECEYPYKEEGLARKKEQGL